MSIVADRVVVRVATVSDAPLILSFIRELAEYEHLLDEVEATEADIRRDLFGENPRSFCEIAEYEGKPVGFALWFYNYSTFRGRAGIYLEDLFVRTEARGVGAPQAGPGGGGRGCRGGRRRRRCGRSRSRRGGDRRRRPQRPQHRGRPARRQRVEQGEARDDRQPPRGHGGEPRQERREDLDPRGVEANGREDRVHNHVLNREER